MEMGDTPMVDKGAFVMLGSDDFFLRQLAAKQDFEAIKDYVAWTMHSAQAIAVKVVNPGGISVYVRSIMTGLFDNSPLLVTMEEACMKACNSSISSA